jgi:hypothetical protein
VFAADAKSGVPRRVGLPSPKGRGWPATALSPAGAGRAFARRRVMDAQGAQPATARRRVRGQLCGEGNTCATHVFKNFNALAISALSK